MLFGKSIEYTLKISPLARNVRFTIHFDGRFTVTIPRRVSESFVNSLLHQKAGWIIKKLDAYKSFSGTVIKKGTKKDFDEHKQKALAFAKERVAYFNRLYQFRFSAIRVRNQRTRWGSCSRTGNLNFNYRILLLAPELADYIVVHELCHLREMNHSPRFWALVSRVFPDYRRLRNDLKRNKIGFF